MMTAVTVDASALKGRGRLGAPPKDGNPMIGGGTPLPPSSATAAINVAAAPSAPEPQMEAPVPSLNVESPVPLVAAPSCPLTGPQGAALAAAIAKPTAARIDGRSLRRTGRTRQLGLKVTAEFDDQLRSIAAARGMMLAEVLEEAMARYIERADMAPGHS